MNKKSFLQNALKYEEILQKIFYNNLGIHEVIMCFTIGLCITKSEKKF